MCRCRHGPLLQTALPRLPAPNPSVPPAAPCKPTAAAPCACCPAGSLKILYSLDLIYFLLAKYAVAVGLTIVTEDSITAVAWDSAGVTTGASPPGAATGARALARPAALAWRAAASPHRPGRVRCLQLAATHRPALVRPAWRPAGPVTVPFVLAIGIGFSVAVGSAEGFGMLTIMSVAPIISVLLFSHLRKPAQHARRGLSRAARSMGRSMHRRAPDSSAGAAPRFKYSQSTVQARGGLHGWAAARGRRRGAGCSTCAHSPAVHPNQAVPPSCPPAGCIRCRRRLLNATHARHQRARRPAVWPREFRAWAAEPAGGGMSTPLPVSVISVSPQLNPETDARLLQRYPPRVPNERSHPPALCRPF